MPKVNTHLHMALKLCKVMCIKDLDSFLLGNAYPDCWETSVKKAFVIIIRMNCPVSAT